MSAFALAHVHQQFEAALPAIVATARYALRRRSAQDRAEGVAEVQAAAWSAWRGLVRRGLDPVEVGVCGIANNAVRYVLNGRRIGNTNCGRGAMDVYHRKAQAACGFRIVSLDRETNPGPQAPSDAWRDWLATDDRVTPADEACFRLDFQEWLAGMPARKRQMAELLAEGHETGVVARMLGVTPAAVSIARTWLEASWREFQGEAAPARRPRGRPRGSGRGARAPLRRQPSVPSC